MKIREKAIFTATVHCDKVFFVLSKSLIGGGVGITVGKRQ